MKYDEFTNKINTTRWQAKLPNGVVIDIYRWTSRQDRYDWNAYKPRKNAASTSIAQGYTDSLEEAKTLAEQAARDYDAKERVK